LALVALLALLACRRDDAIDLPVELATLPPEQRVLDEIDRTRGVRDCFLPIRDGTFVAAPDAPRMRDDELVLGLELGDSSVAYPVLYLQFHEIVEHSLDGQALLVCW
jgi:uncharacterized protein DUF3179